MRAMAVACLSVADDDTSTPAATSPLRRLVEAWAASAGAVIDLVGTLDETDMRQPTDLPGWTVRDIVAHLAHLEAELAGDEPVLAGEQAVPADARDDPFRAYTERGVAARRSRATRELVDELSLALHRLRQTLAVADPAAPPASFPRPGRGWEPLLRDRVFDFWMHEQDIRRAVGRPGGWDSPGALVTLGTFRAALPYVVGKKVRPPAGTTVAWSVHSPSGADEVVVRMDDDGKARVVDLPAGTEPDVTLSMTVETFVLACGGRRRPEHLDAQVAGDRDLGARVLAEMSVTP
jgi:uncharacterized protein (TIGR03083 family)